MFLQIIRAQAMAAFPESNQKASPLFSDFQKASPLFSDFVQINRALSSEQIQMARDFS